MHEMHCVVCEIFRSINEIDIVMKNMLYIF